MENVIKNLDGSTHESHENELTKQLELFKTEILYKIINPYKTAKEGDCVFENPPEIQNGELLLEDLISAIDKFNGDTFDYKSLVELVKLINEDSDVHNYVITPQTQIKEQIFNELMENVEAKVDSAESESLNQSSEIIENLYEKAKSAFCEIFYIITKLEFKKQYHESIIKNKFNSNYRFNKPVDLRPEQ